MGACLCKARHRLHSTSDSDQEDLGSDPFNEASSSSSSSHHQLHFGPRSDSGSSSSTSGSRTGRGSRAARLLSHLHSSHSGSNTAQQQHQANLLLASQTDLALCLNNHIKSANFRSGPGSDSRRNSADQSTNNRIWSLQTKLSSHADRLVLDTLDSIQPTVLSESSNSMQKLHLIAETELGWLVVINSLINKVNLEHPFGSALILLILEDAPLPSRKSISQLEQVMDLEGLLEESRELDELDQCDLAPNMTEEEIRAGVTRQRNISIVLGCLAEKLAGSLSAILFSELVQRYLLTRLNPATNDLNVILYSLIALEKFSQTIDNKRSIEQELKRMGHKNPLHQLEHLDWKLRHHQGLLMRQQQQQLQLRLQLQDQSIISSQHQLEQPSSRNIDQNNNNNIELNSNSNDDDETRDHFKINCLNMNGPIDLYQHQQNQSTKLNNNTNDNDYDSSIGHHHQQKKKKSIILRNNYINKKLINGQEQEQEEEKNRNKLDNNNNNENENKKRLEKKQTRLDRKSLLSSLGDQFLEQQVRFCAQWHLDNHFISDDRTYSYELIDRENLNAILNVKDVSENLKISPDGLTARNDTSRFESVRCTYAMTSGVYYYEVQLITAGVMQIGLATKQSCFLNYEGFGIGDDDHSLAYDGCRQLIWQNAKSGHTKLPRWKEGDFVGCLIDLDKFEVTFSLNGQMGEPNSELFRNKSLSTQYYAAASFMPFQHCVFNFGRTPFKYPPIEYNFRAFNQCASLSEEEKIIMPKHLVMRRTNSLDMMLNMSCTICCDNVAKIMLHPCEHRGLCETCANLLDICPLCRTSIVERKEIPPTFPSPNGQQA